MTHWVKDPEPASLIRHEVQRQLDLVSSVGYTLQDDRMKLQVSEAAIERVQHLLLTADVNTNQPWVVIHPGATAASRRYPPEQFATVARTLVEQFGIQIVFTGTQSEQDLVASIQAMMSAPATSLVGQLNLSELAALLFLARLLIANNTGPVHIAAAVGTPIVNLYALTNPQHIPWHVTRRVLFQDVPCRFCYKSVCPEEHHHCLRLVEPNTVVQAAIDLLNQNIDADTDTDTDTDADVIETLILYPSLQPC